MPEEPTIVMHVRMPRDLYDRVEEFWHDRRLPSRSVGVRILVEERLDQLETPQRKREGKR